MQPYLAESVEQVYDLPVMDDEGALLSKVTTETVQDAWGRPMRWAMSRP